MKDSGFVGQGPGAKPELSTDCWLAALVLQSTPKSLWVCAPGPPFVDCPLSVICQGGGPRPSSDPVRATRYQKVCYVTLIRN